MSVDPNSLTIISINGCEEDPFDIGLPNGNSIDCGEIADQLRELVKGSGIRMLSNDSPITALIDNDGDIYGGIFGNYELPEDFDDFEYGMGLLTFSIVIRRDLRGNRLAEKMIKELIENNRNLTLRAIVVNPIMENVLARLGFELINEHHSIYERNPMPK